MPKRLALHTRDFATTHVRRCYVTLPFWPSSHVSVFPTQRILQFPFRKTFSLRDVRAQFYRCEEHTKNSEHRKDKEYCITTGGGGYDDNGSSKQNARKTRYNSTHLSRCMYHRTQRACLVTWALLAVFHLVCHVNVNSSQESAGSGRV
jgi:hypothetical protein